MVTVVVTIIVVGVVTALPAYPLSLRILFLMKSVLALSSITHYNTTGASRGRPQPSHGDQRDGGP